MNALITMYRNYLYEGILKFLREKKTRIWRFKYTKCTVCIKYLCPLKMVTNYSMDEGEKASWFSISGTFNDHIPLLLSLLDAPPVSSDFQPGILFAPFPWLIAFPTYFLTGHIIFFQKANQKAEFYIAVHVWFVKRSLGLYGM